MHSHDYKVPLHYIMNGAIRTHQINKSPAWMVPIHMVINDSMASRTVRYLHYKYTLYTTTSIASVHPFKLLSPYVS